MSPSKRWLPPEPLPAAETAALSAYPPLIAQLLVRRGLHTAEAASAYLDGWLEAADDPLLLSGLPETVARLQRAIRAGERIAVYGDYDTDGVTATALLVQVLAALGGRPEPYIPDRENEGYGLNVDALRKLKHSGVGMVITVDCGVRSLEEADEARRLNLDLIITDHHHPDAELPRALAVVNPKQPGDAYPEKGLAGVGLAYKVAQGLVRPLAVKPINGSDVLDLVALGTVADLAPLTGENRVLVRQGLGVLNKARREGLKALLGVSRLAAGKLDAGSIGFALGPRLNAAGRLESAVAAYELMVTADVFRASQLAQQLDSQNRERQELTRWTHRRAREIALQAGPEPLLLFAADPQFRAGVVGLAASRLTDEFYRPAVVASQGDEFTKGSARSIPEFHITEALDECRDLLERHGGHAAAAGFTVHNSRLDELAGRLRAIAGRRLAGLDLRSSLKVDAEIARLSDLNMELVRQLKQFEPCGLGNPTPLFAVYGLKVLTARAVGADNSHLKLGVSDGSAGMEAIAFRQGAWHGRLPDRIDLAFTLETNEWNGQTRLQLNVRDLREA